MASGDTLVLPEIWDCTAEEYHADTAIGHSMLEDFRKSPALYVGRATNMIAQREASDEMILGSALHVRVLERDQWDNKVAVAPRCDRRTRDGKAVWAEFEARAGTRLRLTVEAMGAVVSMARSIEANNAAAGLLGMSCAREFGVRWTDAATGLECKCRPDAWTDSGLIVDLKTSRDPSSSAWRRQAANYGYHRQAAWYIHGCEMHFGFPHEHVFIVVGNTEPFDCFCYRLNHEAIALGAQQNRADLDRLYGCVRSGLWKVDGGDAVRTISIPTWAFMEDQLDE